MKYTYLIYCALFLTIAFGHSQARPMMGNTETEIKDAETKLSGEDSIMEAVDNLIRMQHFLKHQKYLSKRKQKLALENYMILQQLIGNYLNQSHETFQHKAEKWKLTLWRIIETLIFHGSLIIFVNKINLEINKINIGINKMNI